MKAIIDRIVIKSSFSFKLNIRHLRQLRRPKMAHSFDVRADSPRLNGWDRFPRPFMIGVAGGTASGKVCQSVFTIVVSRYSFDHLYYVDITCP